MPDRYAVFLSPDPDTPLGRLGWAWLGRAPKTGEEVVRPSTPGLSPEQIRSLTTTPRVYGFHATLKAPLRLKDGATAGALADALAAFASERQPFDGPRLEVRELGRFMALRPEPESARLNDLAADCVREFDKFRAPPTARNLARRKAAKLSPGEAALLERWGYPYVMEAFRFHMTLTNTLPDEDRAEVKAKLTGLFSEVCSVPWSVDGLVLFKQAEPGADFLVDRRFAFGAF